MTKRTYYCFQGVSTYPAGEIYVSTRKPKEIRGVYKIRAETPSEARLIYENQWNKDCQDSLAREGE